MSVGQGTVPAWRLNLCYLFLVNDGDGRRPASENWLWEGSGHGANSLGRLRFSVDSEVPGFRKVEVWLASLSCARQAIFQIRILSCFHPLLEKFLLTSNYRETSGWCLTYIFVCKYKPSR